MEDQQQALERAFCLLDQEGGEGTLPVNKLGQLLQLMGQNPTQADLQDLMTQIDENGDNELSKDEFMNFVMTTVQPKSKEEVDEELMNAFMAFDTDETGEISKEELKDKLQNNGEEPLDDEDIDSLFAALDTNEDGGIQITELMKLFSMDAYSE